jgi:hypothetical protein
MGQGVTKPELVGCSCLVTKETLCGENIPPIIVKTGHLHERLFLVVCLCNDIEGSERRPEAELFPLLQEGPRGVDENTRDVMAGSNCPCTFNVTKEFAHHEPHEAPVVGGEWCVTRVWWWVVGVG